MIDLHTHTTCSDGTDSPRELVNKAIVQGLGVLGISDHDTTSGWEEATQSLRGSLQLALGAEISCLTNDGISVHMLGLLFDPLHEEMQQVLENQLCELRAEEQTARQVKARAMRDTEMITDEMQDEVIELLKAFKLPYVIADGEAEAQCAVFEEVISYQ